METKKKLRCPIGIPSGILAAIIGLVGIIYNSINFNWMSLLISIALLLLGMPFVRIIMMVHSANDRLDEIESKLADKNAAV
ncbi:hypothetical protein ACFL5M_01430 [Candidatus Neomarinimicrobiota bacterium]